MIIITVRERILQALRSRPMTATQLSKKLNVCYSHLWITKNELLAEDLIEITPKDKKSKLIKLK